MTTRKLILMAPLVALLAAPVMAAVGIQGGEHGAALHHVMSSPYAIAALVIFAISYVAIVTEDFHDMRKSKPSILAAGLIWAVIGMGATSLGVTDESLHEAVLHNFTEFGQMFLFLLVAMTYINAMNQRNVFAVLRVWLTQRGYSKHQLFWITGLMAFFGSSIADNLTAAMLLGAVIVAVGSNNPRFCTIACVNIVVAANAGGAFSPFGDLTTLMVWQSGTLEFFQFFPLFVPSVVAWIVPASIMHFFIRPGQPEAFTEEVQMKRGARRTCGLFLVTIGLAVTFEQALALPAFLGMMTGLSLLMICTYYIRMTGPVGFGGAYDIYREVSRSEWDTLLFFFGVIFSVGGLRFLGYLDWASMALYGNLGNTATNIIAGVASAIIDNIPVMFAILSMEPEMSEFQWLLITLSVGVGGSMLSIGSAAGVGLMGVARGRYTFIAHLKWAPVILLGYAAAIGTHFLINGPG